MAFDLMCLVADWNVPVLLLCCGVLPVLPESKLNIDHHRSILLGGLEDEFCDFPYNIWDNPSQYYMGFSTTNQYSCLDHGVISQDAVLGAPS